VNNVADEMFRMEENNCNEYSHSVIYGVCDGDKEACMELARTVIADG